MVNFWVDHTDIMSVWSTQKFTIYLWYMILKNKLKLSLSSPRP